jgi:hypothetical protein
VKLQAFLIFVFLSPLFSQEAKLPLKFEDFPAAKRRTGRPATPKLTSQFEKMYRTRIREGAKHPANFAGHYTVVDWGCGTSCGVYVIVDNLTGRVYEPPEISKGVDLGVAEPAFRPDSTLLAVASCPPPKDYGLKDCERKFYKWDGSRLVLLKTEPVTSTEKGR